MPNLTSWTPYDNAQLLYKRDIEKKKWRVIAAEMGRGLTTCQHQWMLIKHPPLPETHKFVKIFRVPESIIRDRNYRASLAPRDLTAAFFGDPPVGYSALERRT
jgi:hypothetical protein